MTGQTAKAMRVSQRTPWPPNVSIRLTGLCALAVAILVFVCGPAATQRTQRSATVAGDSPRGNTWAVVVGVDYSDPGATHGRLNYSTSDARLFLDTLEVDKERATLLLSGGDAPTQRRVLDAIEQAAKRSGPNDVLFFYFAGHGRESGGSTYLAPSDARFENLQSYISVKKLRELLNDPVRSHARAKILVIDACHSGSPRGDSRPFQVAAEGLSGTVTIAACQTDQYSWEFKDLQHGVFTYYMAQGLSGAGAKEGQDLVFISQLRDFVTKAVQERTKNCIPPQTPVFLLPPSLADSPISRRRPGVLAKIQKPPDAELVAREPLKPGVFVVATMPGGVVDDFIQGRLQSELVKTGYPVVSRETAAQFAHLMHDPKNTAQAAQAAKRMEARFLLRVTSEYSPARYDGSIGRFFVNCTVTAEVLDVYGNIKGAASVDADQHPNAGSGATATVARERARQRAIENILPAIEEDLDALVHPKR